MKILGPIERFQHMAAILNATTDNSHLEPPKHLTERPYYAGVDWESHRRLQSRAGVGSLHYSDREVAPFCNSSKWDSSIPWVRDFLEAEENRRKQLGFVPLLEFDPATNTFYRHSNFHSLHSL